MAESRAREEENTRRAQSKHLVEPSRKEMLRKEENYVCVYIYISMEEHKRASNGQNKNSSSNKINSDGTEL